MDVRDQAISENDHAAASCLQILVQTNAYAGQHGGSQAACFRYGGWYNRAL
jgi:hypothetical protein